MKCWQRPKHVHAYVAARKLERTWITREAWKVMDVGNGRSKAWMYAGDA